MARLKSRPLQRTTKRKLQDRDRVLREGLRTSSSKRLRLQSPAERSISTSKKGKKKKGMVFDWVFVCDDRLFLTWFVGIVEWSIEQTTEGKYWIKFRGLVPKLLVKPKCILLFSPEKILWRSLILEAFLYLVRRFFANTGFCWCLDRKLSGELSLSRVDVEKVCVKIRAQNSFFL